MKLYPQVPAIHTHPIMQSDLVNPSVALFGACKILLHKLRLETDRTTLVSTLTACQDEERAARRVHSKALDDVQRAENALEEAKRALEHAKQTAKDLEVPLKSAVATTDKIRRDLSMVDAEIKECEADFVGQENTLKQAYESVAALSRVAAKMEQGHWQQDPLATPTAEHPTRVHYFAPNPVTDAVPCAVPSMARIVTQAKEEEKVPQKPAPEERSDAFIAKLNELGEQLPGEVYADGRTYFFVGDLTRIFSPDLKDPNKTGAAHSRTYGMVEGEYRQGVRKQAGRWIMTLEAFEAYVKPHLRSVRRIEY